MFGAMLKSIGVLEVAARAARREFLNLSPAAGKSTLCPPHSGSGGRQGLGCMAGREACQAPKQALAVGELYLP